MTPPAVPAASEVRANDLLKLHLPAKAPSVACILCAKYLLCKILHNLSGKEPLPCSFPPGAVRLFCAGRRFCIANRPPICYNKRKLKKIENCFTGRN